MHGKRVFQPRPICAAIVAALAATLAACGNGGHITYVSPPSGGGACAGRCIEVSPSDNDQETVLRVLIDARPGDVITLRAGTYRFTGQLSLDVDNVTIRGEGMDRTILSFRNQTLGAEGLFVTANAFTIEDLALEDSPGDLLKIIGADGVTIRRVRAEWTRGPDTDNGSYGFYPVESRNVLIEESIVRGASDAGVYVGQSHNVIVRRNRAEFNVAGIEIENSTDADVYENTATRNTGGILVFNLPGLPFIDGRRTRVFHNQVFDNNTPNFAPRGSIVAGVPTGTGVMLLANDEVQVFENTLRDNGTTHVLILSYHTAAILAGLSGRDPNSDKYSETLYIYNNTYEHGGATPDDGVADLNGTITGIPMPDITIDGFEDPRKLVDGQLPDGLRTCIQEAAVRFYDVDLPHVGLGASPDLAPFDCRFDPLPQVVIPGVGDVAPTPGPPVPTTARPTPTPPAGNTETRCAVPPGTGVNFDPADEPCELLSSYRFFTGPASAMAPNDGVVPYDLNTQLFSDYAVKHRFVWLPPGTAAGYSDRDSFEFPVGSVIIKTFTYPNDARDPAAGEQLIETRLLLLYPHGWVALPYVWNADHTDARLQTTGASLTVTGIGADGSQTMSQYNVPNANQCKECHRESIDVTGPLGPKARHLNKDYTYAEGTENQLAHWTRLGILRGAPDPSQAPRTAVFDDPSSGTLEQRARGYLDVNCSSCHNENGAARTSGLYLTAHETAAVHLGICKSPVAAGIGTGGFQYDIVPGKPDESILTYRMVSVQPGVAMPELGRQRVHTEGVAVIADWIRSLPGECRME